MTPMHLGTLHPAEQIATLLLAFGPFIVLGVVVIVRRRADARADEGDQGDGLCGDGRDRPDAR
ncbi:hypothetical protein [Nocardioides sp. TF02-7]|uniref:hypothetical protein n=1 Tax=Nocardioides sp. TF02-7 TaxID=2917724 RepID=UPI001F05EA2F|nr:hypothetical protein [Nocardioides sp. TF02-7]UMG92256.1 hypothetical protein MF408_20475 [Nocardioides sp. TF02-7]